MESEIIDLDDLSPHVHRIGGDDPLRVYLAIAITNPAPNDPHSTLAHVVEDTLVEHGFLCYNPLKTSPRDSFHSPEEIYAVNYGEVARSDIVFFVRVAPSVGMGMEAQIAANQIIPWSQLKEVNESGIQQTPVLVGLANLPCSDKHTVVFEDISKTAQSRERLISTITSPCFRNTAIQVRTARHQAKATIEEGHIGSAIRRQRLLYDLPLHEIAERAGMSAFWLDAAERNTDIQCGLSVSQLVRAADAVQGRLAMSPNGTSITIVPVDGPFRSEIVESASRFAEFTLRKRNGVEPSPEPDETMRTRWRAMVLKEGENRHAPKTRQLTPVEHLQVELIPPMSNLAQVPEQQVSDICKAVSDELKCFSSILIKLSDPRASEHYIRTNRQDMAGKIYRGSIARILHADLVISILSPPATGVGVMSQAHADAGVPRLAIVADHAVSRMYLGLFVPLIGGVVRYGPSSDIAALIRKALTDHWQSLARMAAWRRDVVARIVRAGIPRAIHKHRLRHKQTLDAFVQEACKVLYVDPDWLRAVATIPRFSATLTLIQMVHIAQALGWTITINRDGIPCWDVPKCESAGLDSALDNLVVAGEQINWSANEEKVLAEWAKCEMAFATGAARVAKKYSVDYWKERIFPEQLS